MAEPDMMEPQFVDQRKKTVQDAYDLVARQWGENRRALGYPAGERVWIERCCATLQRRARVLDLGCGTGSPILAALVDAGYRAVGVDFSWTALRQVQVSSPQAALIYADLAEVQFARASFHAAIAFDSIWHIPQQEHASVFSGIRRWLVDGARFLLTLGAAPGDASELVTELVGAPIYYSAVPADESLELLRASGFSILDHHFQPVTPAQPSTGHLTVLLEAA